MDLNFLGKRKQELETSALLIKMNEENKEFGDADGVDEIKARRMAIVRSTRVIAIDSAWILFLLRISKAVPRENGEILFFFFFFFFFLCSCYYRESGNERKKEEKKRKKA
jgi:hypothetical protein